MSLGGRRGPGRETDGLPRWYSVVLLLAAAQRLRELRVSAVRERGLKGERACPRGYPAMVAAHVGLFLLPPFEAHLRGTRSRHPRGWLGLLVAAFGLRWWSIRELGPQWNVRAMVPEQLTPVTTGPYRVIRHPNYLAVILEFLALPMALGARRSCLVLSLANLGVLACRVRAEERLLDRHPGYRRAFAGRARLIPGVF